MDHASSSQVALTVSLALAAGMVAQSLARHMRLPGIVLLLAAGVLLGPDISGVVDPGSLGEALQVLVGFAVAVILFEGGMNLNATRLRRQATAIRRLITVGALVTAAGGTLIARYVMEWEWQLAVPFGALVVVTGPTVITPLLRRIKVNHRVETVLEAEGVLIDAIGAVLAVVTLEAVLSFSAESLAGGMFDLVVRLGFGFLCGALGGVLIAFLLRFKQVVPEGFENVLTLSLVLALFQVSNALLPESGIASVTIAGMVVGNVRTRALRDLMEFKEQLTLMFIGLLFVLLAADVRLTDVLELGWRGVAAVAGLMVVVRPLNVLLSTQGSDLSGREKLFLSWLAPRGVVAAAVASLFAQTLDAAGIEGGTQLRALVFMVIAGTVVVQGLSGGWVAGLLGLRRSVARGYAILGANALGRSLGRLLSDAGHEVVLIDNSPSAIRDAEDEGFRVVFGNAIEERTLMRAGMDERLGCIAVTPGEGINLLFADAAIEDFQPREVYVALRQTQRTVVPEMVRRRGAHVLFGRPRDIELWTVRFRRKLTQVERYRKEREPEGDANEKEPFGDPEQLLLPLLLDAGGRVRPVGSDRPFRAEDVVQFALFADRADEARGWLERQGWVRVPVEGEGA